MYTIRHYKKDFANLAVAIVGDILHSRVARSDIHALIALGAAEVRAVGPQTLLPAAIEKMGVRVCHDLGEGIRDCDVVIMLRLQNERMNGALLPSAREYFRCYGLTPMALALAKPDAIVMHPGPMNRGVEIDSDVADGPQAVILPQVTFGTVSYTHLDVYKRQRSGSPDRVGFASTRQPLWPRRGSSKASPPHCPRTSLCRSSSG